MGRSENANDEQASATQAADVGVFKNNLLALNRFATVLRRFWIWWFQKQPKVSKLVSNPIFAVWTSSNWIW